MPADAESDRPLMTLRLDEDERGEYIYVMADRMLDIEPTSGNTVRLRNRER